MTFPQMNDLVEVSDLRPSAPRLPAQALPRDVPSLRRILVCVDRSTFSEPCLRYAVAISRSLGGAITILHVMEPPRERAGRQTTNVLDWEVSRQEASAYLEHLDEEGTRAMGRRVETRLEQGHPAARITAVARELHAELTVLGSQGERGATWNLGSTAQQVLAVARGSVLIVRSSSGGAADVSPKRILVPLDGSLRAESVLPTAVRIAGANDAELLLVVVVSEPVPTAVLRAPEDLEVARDLATRLEASGQAYLEGLREQLVREGATVRTLVLRSSNERQCLVELSTSERSDLVILSAHGSTCNPALTCGSVTAHLSTHSVVPLLVLQDLAESELRGQERGRPAPPPRASYPETV
jgi:nucleotide-binding universal stress UspA family protein